MGNEIKFKPATFYLGIVDHLAKAVEELKPEDVNVERDGDDRRVKRGHGEILDAASQVGAEQVTATVEEGATKILPAKLSSSNEPRDMGKDGVTGQVPSSGSVESTVTSKYNDEAADAPLPAILETATPTPARKSDPHTSPPRHQPQGSDPR